jgi:hypothetical protein
MTPLPPRGRAWHPRRSRSREGSAGDSQRHLRQREDRGYRGGYLGVHGPEIPEHLIEADGRRGVRPLARIAGGFDQRVDELERALERTRRIVGEERRLKRGLEFVRDERCEVLERLIPSSEVHRRARQPLLDATAPENRHHAGQRRNQPRIATTTDHDDLAPGTEREPVTLSLTGPMRRAESQLALLVGCPPFNPRSVASTAEQSDDTCHSGVDLLSSRELQGHPGLHRHLEHLGHPRDPRRR